MHKWIVAGCCLLASAALCSDRSIDDAGDSIAQTDARSLAFNLQLLANNPAVAAQTLRSELIGRWIRSFLRFQLGWFDLLSEYGPDQVIQAVTAGVVITFLAIYTALSPQLDLVGLLPRSPDLIDLPDAGSI